MALDIRHWSEIDAAWLTEVLAEGGVTASITDFTAKPVGTGQVGDCVRFGLAYDDAPDSAPASLVGKFPADAEKSRATGVALWNYLREVKFYKLLQARAGVATPKCYFTDINEETHDFVLIMADAAPAEQGDQLVGVTIEQARLALKEAAKFHAAFWNDESLHDYPWVTGTKDAPSFFDIRQFAGFWTAFKDRYRDRITPKAIRIGDAIAGNFEQGEVMRAGVRSLVHSDFRPDNMLFSTAAGGDPLLVVDWQSFAYGAPVTDIGYFIAGAITAEERRTHETELLRLYKEELVRYGGGPYDQEEFYRHYICGAYGHFIMAFVAAMIVTQTERGDDMFFKMMNGAVDLISDHKAEDWYD